MNRDRRQVKERYNFRLDPELMGHIRSVADKKGKTLTHYVERALRSYSKFKEKELA